MAASNTVINTQLTTRNNASVNASVPGSVLDASDKAVSNKEISDMFVTLLVAEVRNQNPLDPMDPAQFMSQLMQLSQMQITNSTLTEVKNSTARLSELHDLALGGRIGSTAFVKTDSVQIDGSPFQGRLTLTREEPQLTLKFVGADGKETAVSLGPKSAGDVPFTVDPTAHRLSQGRYTLSVVDAGGSPIPFELGGVVKEAVWSGKTGASQISLSGLGRYPTTSISRFVESHSSSTI